MNGRPDTGAPGDNPGSAPAPAPAVTTATRNPLVEVRQGGSLPPVPKSAWLEIDLDALVSNIRVLRGILPQGTRIEPVVKADAYGHGAVAVSRALVAEGIASLVVATYDEALELREAGITVPILILFPIPAELAPDALRHALSIAVGDRLLLARTLAALMEGPEPQGPCRQLPVYLEVETGLGRGGVLPEEVAEIAAIVEACPRARLAGMWSHLQAAADAGITSGQDAEFGRASGLLEAAGRTLPVRHIAASGGLLAATAGTYDVVRIGIAQYGIVPDGMAATQDFAEAAAALKPILSLRARPVRVAWLDAGTGISYGPTFTTARRSCIVTLPVGYADGYPRSLSNKAQVLVRGRRVPQVGTVAMDAVMVDVTDVPGPEITIDDEFTLIGEQGNERISAVEVARWGNTISYEILAAMSGRLPRVYYAAASPVALRAVACETGRGLRRPVGAPGEVEDGPGPLDCG